MSDQTPQSSNQQPVVIALVVVAVLLAALVGVLILNQNKAANTPTTTTGATTGGTTGATTGGAAAPAGPFDPKTATKLPAGMTAEQALKAYNEAVIAGKFADAYKLLPADKQKSYGDATAYGSQVKAYGITSYKVGKSVTSDGGKTVTIAATQVTPQMPITYTWTFKQDGGQWYVASRTMGGTVP